MVISPAQSLGIISDECRDISNRRFRELGLELSFSKHAEEMDEFKSSSINSRIEDLHEAFRDPSVKMVIATIGGFNSNQLLPYIDFDLIHNNPKIFCGFSDITAIQNAIFAKTGLVTYSSPAYSSFGEKQNFDYSMNYFKKCLYTEDEFTIEPSQDWSNDEWYLNQDNRVSMPNEGFWVINEGSAVGVIIGANLCTFNLLHGTEYMPNLESSILFLEDDHESKPGNFDRNLESITQLPNFGKVKGLVIGRFEKASKIDKNLLFKIIRNKKALNNIPVIANVDFGHTEPRISFPIGGTASVSATKEKPKIIIKNH